MQEEVVRAALNAVGTRFVSVTFKKNDGSTRKLTGLLHPTSKIKGVSMEPAPVVKAGYTPIWVPKIGWRCFKIAAVTEISADNTKIVGKN